MLFLQIKQAQCAVDEGRLDEAFELVRSPDLRSHRRGQELTDRLVEALVVRGREHLARQRFGPAFTDCTKAEHLAGNAAAVTELRTAITRAVEDRQRIDRMQAMRVDEARRQIDKGFLSLGRNLLEQAEPTDQAKGLLHQAEVRRMEAATLAYQIRMALDRDDLELALNSLQQVKRLGVCSDPINELIARGIERGLAKVRVAVEKGRLDSAENLLPALNQLNGEKSEIRELSLVLEKCRRAAASLCRGEWAMASRFLKQAAVMVPGGEWIKDAIAGVEQAARVSDDLLAGPLGLITPMGSGDRMVDPPNNGTTDDPDQKTLHIPDGSALPSRFLIRMDAVGSFLVVRDSRVTVGAVSATLRPLVGLAIDPNLPVLTIERVEEDYFLKAGAANSGKLLADGETIPLGPRGRIKFSRPHGASTTAVLRLSGVQLPQGDVREVILLDRELIVGPNPSAHIRTSLVAEPLVLYVRDGQLFCRTALEVAYNNQKADSSQPIPTGAHIRIGPLSFTVTAI